MKSKLIYEKNIKLTTDATLALQAFETTNNKKKFITEAVVIYDDGERIKLEPVVSSKEDRYTWQNGRIYRHLGNNVIDNKVFSIKDRKNKRVTLNGNKIIDIMNNETLDNTSARFESIIELENGNRLLLNTYWGYNGSLNEAYHLLNTAGELSYVALRTICSPDECELFEGTILYENYIIFYCWLDDKRTIPHISRIYDLSNNPPKEYSTGNRFFETMDESAKKTIKRLIRKQKEKH